MASLSVSHLHIFIFPFMAPGHSIPAMHVAKMFVERGCRSTVIATQYNKGLLLKEIEKAKRSNCDVDYIMVELPLDSVDLTKDLASLGLLLEISKAISSLREQEHRSDCLVSDKFLAWTVDVAAELWIPRIVLDTSSFFATACSHSIVLNKSLWNAESFLIPGIPDEISMNRKQLPPSIDEEDGFTKLM